MKQGDKVLVTGITGYVASWIGKYLLEEGYSVRGTVRRLQDERNQTIKKILPGVELVEANLREREGWEEAVKDCKWVFHVATPQAVKTESQRTEGAISGTVYVLEAAFKSGTVKKVVLTSSEAAIAYGFPSSKLTFDEDDWTQLEKISEDYIRSKTLAEMEAWRMSKDPQMNPNKVEFTSINPGLILGPTLVPWGRFSLNLIQDISLGKIPMLPDVDMHVVDVRDCAMKHIAVMKDSHSNGKRYLTFGTADKTVEIAKIIKKEFGKSHGFHPSTRLAPNFLIWFVSFFDASAYSVYSKCGMDVRYKTKYPEVYQYKYTNLNEIIRETVLTLVENGSLPKLK